MYKLQVASLGLSRPGTDIAFVALSNAYGLYQRMVPAFYTSRRIYTSTCPMPRQLFVAIVAIYSDISTEKKKRKMEISENEGIILRYL